MHQAERAGIRDNKTRFTFGQGASHIRHLHVDDELHCDHSVPRSGHGGREGDRQQNRERQEPAGWSVHIQL